MRNTREIVRQKWLLKRPHRAISESVGVSLGAVSLALERATEAELTWEGIESLDDAELEARLYPTVVAAASRPEPDCTWVHRERHRPGVTLELLHHEYLEQHPDGLRYTTFCDRYRDVARSARAGDAAGARRRRQGVRRLLGQEAADRRSDDGRGHRGRALRRGARRVEPHVRRGDVHAARPRLDREPRARPRVLRRRAGGAGAGPAQVGRDARMPVRARGAAHVRGARAALRDDGAAGAPAAPARQGEGRGRRADRAAMVARAHPRRGVPLARRAERAPARAARRPERPRDAAVRQEPPRALRGDRARGAASAAGDALRVRRLAEGAREHRLPRAGRRAPVLGAVSPRARGGRGSSHRRRRGDPARPRARRVAPPLEREGRLHDDQPSTCRARTARTRSGRRRAS